MIKKSLIALSIGAFGLGIAEFAMMGILVNVANGLDISIVKAGHFISAYAFGVCVGAPILLLVRKYPLKYVLMFLASMILIGNLLAGLASNYWMLLIARFLSGLPHGAYFGVASIVAQQLVTEGKGSQAVSIILAGMTFATVVGVPLGTALSTLFSWRLNFLLIACWGMITLYGIGKWIPQINRLPDMGFKGQFRFLKSPAPWLITMGILLGNGEVYCWYRHRPIIDKCFRLFAGKSDMANGSSGLRNGFRKFVGRTFCRQISSWTCGGNCTIMYGHNTCVNLFSITHSMGICCVNGHRHCGVIRCR